MADRTAPLAMLRRRTRTSAVLGHAVGAEEWIQRLLLGLVGVWLLTVVALPLLQIAQRSLEDRDGHFVGLANYVAYFSTPSVSVSLFNSLFVALVTTVVSVGLGFVFAYAVTRTNMPGKAIFFGIAMLPLYAPSLVHGIALIYLFGNKGLVTTGFFGLVPGWNIGLYGPTGIILGEIFYCFPQAVLILVAALSLTDARLYEAALALRASRWRTFVTVTLPGVQYALISTVFVCFTLAFTDFGVAKVVGGNYNVLATDIYKQVIGQQNFARGATISLLLLGTTVIAFVADRFAQRRQVALVTARSAPYQPKPSPVLDRTFAFVCALICGAILAVLGAALLGSVVTVWPYDFTPTLKHYTFQGVGGGGYDAFWNSIRMSLYTAVFGTAIVFGSAYLVEKSRTWHTVRSMIHFASILPIALPGLVLGLAYIFFFNRPTFSVGALEVPNPFASLYGTMALLVISNIVHFYTVGVFTASTALKQLDPEFEAVSASMRVPFYKTFWRVTIPVCLPALLQIGVYFFVNAMVTVSAVIFLYPPSIKLASVAVVNMDDAGQTASAAAMSMLIVCTSLSVRLLYNVATRGFQTRSQAWLRR